MALVLVSSAVVQEKSFSLSSSETLDNINVGIAVGRKRKFEGLATLDLFPLPNRTTQKFLNAKLQARKLKLECGSCYIPKEDEEYPRGQDAHFVCSADNVIGVADGLGGFKKRGIDAGVYARNLMSHASSMTTARATTLPACPLRILKKAASATRAQGGSTACIIALQGRKIVAANVGDSGFLVVRNGKVAYRSPVQVRGFNSPLYLHTDSCKWAQVLEVPVEEGDSIVAATDGLFDNLFEDTILNIISKGRKYEFNPRTVAQLLARVAHQMSLQKKHDTPFSKASREAGRLGHQGGKRDDITVVVANVISSAGS
ncbi:hypothetical protein H6P81_004603 [Aristolochia fimbriata]|uniref:Protein phosphatase n=1 Tax=Aristolochia fimbriata TaxID=158543 RepID=A0AAV7ET26_ARIFI|nr:hypothetical protein H6P81_004603 [Aristolochia fimbriata]